MLAFAAACGDSTTDPGVPSVPANETFAASLGVNIPAMTKKSDDLYIQDVVAGTGAEATNGRILRVMYTGYLANGQRFDGNEGGAPFTFTLGGNVITGWNQGLAGMRVGGKRKLVIGSNLGYGPSGSGRIPGNATLVFNVELVSMP
jgi:FKBP-type peptidyl-prolyl cis-trans isomerase